MGERWSRHTDFDGLSGTTGEFDAIDYVAMYWFNDPVDESVSEWNQLEADSFEWGRGPSIPGPIRLVYERGYDRRDSGARTLARIPLRAIVPFADWLGAPLEPVRDRG